MSENTKIAGSSTGNTGSSSLSEAEKFLESLNLPESNADASNESGKAVSDTHHNDIMSFLDEIAQIPAETSKDASPAGGQSQPAKTADEKSAPKQEGSSWAAWGTSLWSQASAAVKTTTEQLNRSVAASELSTAKLLEERVKHLQGMINKENFEKIGNELRSLTSTLLETVAPPISEHELVEIFLSHETISHVGLEALVYRAFARVMEQTESGHVVVRNVDSNKENQTTEENLLHNLKPTDGVAEGIRLAKENLENLVKTHYKAPEPSTSYTPQSGAVPVINCPVFLAIQPTKISFSEPGTDKDDKDQQLSFVVMLVDPTHQLRFKTYSQSIPFSWLEVPYEENEWVEEKTDDVIRMAVTTIAQDYVWTRMNSAKQATRNPAERKTDASNTEDKASSDPAPAT